METWQRREMSVGLGTVKGKKYIGRTRFRMENAVKMNLTKMGWMSVDWIKVVQNVRVDTGVREVMFFLEP